MWTNLELPTKEPKLKILKSKIKNPRKLFTHRKVVPPKSRKPLGLNLALPRLLAGNYFRMIKVNVRNLVLA